MMNAVRQPTIASASEARRARSLLSIFVYSVGSSVFSSAVVRASKLNP